MKTAKREGVPRTDGAIPLAALCGNGIANYTPNRCSQANLASERQELVGYALCEVAHALVHTSILSLLERLPLPHTRIQNLLR
jgi:hypothetical protein